MSIIYPPEGETPLQQRQKQAKDIVNGIDPETFPKIAFNQKNVVFKLAREFMSLGGDVEDFRPAINVLYERIGKTVTEETLWEYLITAFEEMIIPPDKRNWVAWAHAKALAEPVMLPAHIPVRSPQRQTVYGICWHLAAHHDPLPFELSRERLAEVLHMEKSGVSSIVTWLVKNALIAPLDANGDIALRPEDEYYRRNARCKRYRLGSRIKEQMGGMPVHFEL